MRRYSFISLGDDKNHDNSSKIMFLTSFSRHQYDLLHTDFDIFLVSINALYLSRFFLHYFLVNTFPIELNIYLSYILYGCPSTNISFPFI